MEDNMLDISYAPICLLTLFNTMSYTISYV